MMTNQWEVSCTDQRFDDENFEVGRSVVDAGGRFKYEVYPYVFATRNEANKFAKLLNEDLKK
jgi:hypothetical protein